METPAEKSAKMIHLLAEERRTHCGITFRRQRFQDRNITPVPEGSTCAKCTAAYVASIDVKDKK